MSMSLWIVFPMAVAPDSQAISEAFRTTETPVTLSAPLDLRSHHGGFFPFKLDGKEAGFEIYEITTGEIASVLEPAEQKLVGISFVYGSDPRECAAAFYAASVLAGAFDAFAIESESGERMGKSQLSEAGALCLGIANGEITLP